MKIKYLLIVGLILTIMTMGAVSASDNITADDLAVDEVDDVVEEVDDSIQNEELMADDDSIVYDDGEIECIIYPNVNYGSYQYIVEFTSHNSSITGDLHVNIEDGYSLHRTITSDSYDENGNYYTSVANYDLYNLEYGRNYNINVTLNDALILSGTLKVSNFQMQVNVDNSYDDGYIEYGDIVFFTIWIPDDAAGKLTLTVNGKTYDVKYKDGKGVVAVDSHGWKLGENVAFVKYEGDAQYNETLVKKTFTVHLQVSYPFVPNGYGNSYLIYMSAGEKESITFTAPSGTSGKVEVSIIRNGAVIKSQNVTVSNGYGSYTLSGLDAGAYIINLYGMIDGLKVDQELMLEVCNNSKDITASPSASQITVGGNAVIKISGPAMTMAAVLVDDVFVKGIYLQGGNIAEAISGLGVGTHEIKIVVFSTSSYSLLYSKTFSITVKPVPDTVKLTLKKVKVKRSAKKLVISATLKINGKAKKGLKVNFKFNKKSYTAKTNAKGVAKVTIKKSILKKLKKGKKVTYHASYGKTTKKITVKILK